MCRRWVSLRWIPPPVGVLKLNIDGSSRGNPGAAGAGYVLRDWEGRFIFGLAVPILHASTLMAEARALYFGLRILSFLHLNGVRVLVETDSKFIQHCIRCSSLDIPWEVLHVIQDCSHLFSSMVCTELIWNYREANFVADAFANFASDRAEDDAWLSNSMGMKVNVPTGLLELLEDGFFFWWLKPPNFVCNLLLFDLTASCTERFIPQ
ncbi:hypothetical protein IFM89_012576 [Coptis chinensis]|uniref:RNase H type-1 domain-containing protein n=1 Tax=Coptis chinensis TaxID=261450 RepID=A0A835LH01_9MAGN|nr:hypothetical protein IFM89_012576 [Coptis chinensis]